MNDDGDGGGRGGGDDRLEFWAVETSGLELRNAGSSAASVRR